MMNAIAIPAVPVLDFRTMLKLDSDDTLEGYNLCLGGVIHVRLEEIEKAYMAADAAGLVAGTLVKFNYGSKQVAVVTGRNLSVMSNFGSPSRTPIELHSARGYYDYGIDDATPIEGPAKVIGLLKATAELVEGVITAVGVRQDEKGYTYATVTINGHEYSMRDFAELELVPTLH